MDSIHLTCSQGHRWLLPAQKLPNGQYFIQRLSVAHPTEGAEALTCPICHEGFVTSQLVEEKH